MYNLITPICRTSYGKVGEHIALNTNCALFPIGPVYSDHTEIEQKINNAKQADLSKLSIKIWHQWDLITKAVGPLWGMPIFELNQFTDKEKYHMSSIDGLIVNSEWAASLVSEYNKVEVIPLGVDTNKYYPNPQKRNKTIFLNIGKAEIRKGHDILPEIYNRAFPQKEDVELWMIMNNPFLKPEAYNKFRAGFDKCINKVRFLPEMSEHQLINIINQADCGIFPTRAEGFCLPLLEMMACGKQVITTNYSGQTQFCTPENAYLVDIEKLEPAIDPNWSMFNGFAEWAFLGNKQINQFAEYMRNIHNNIQFNAAGVSTAQSLDWSIIGKNIELFRIGQENSI